MDTFTDILPKVYTSCNTLSRLIFLCVTVTPVVQVTYSDTFTDILPIVYTGFNTLSRLIFLYVTVTPVVQVTYSDTFTDILVIVYTGFNTLSRLIFLSVTVTPVVQVTYNDGTITCSADANPITGIQYVIFLNDTAQTPGTTVQFNPDDYGCTEVRCDVSNSIGTGTAALQESLCPGSCLIMPMCV